MRSREKEREREQETSSFDGEEEKRTFFVDVFPLLGIHRGRLFEFHSCRHDLFLIVQRGKCI